MTQIQSPYPQEIFSPRLRSKHFPQEEVTSHIEALLLEGDGLLNLGNVFEAMDQYNKVFEYDKGNMEAHHRLVEVHFAMAKLYLDRKEYNEALFYIDRAISGDAQGKYFAVRVEIFQALDNYEEAAKDRKCIENEYILEEPYYQIRKDTAATLRANIELISCYIDLKETRKSRAAFCLFG